MLDQAEHLLRIQQRTIRVRDIARRRGDRVAMHNLNERVIAQSAEICEKVWDRNR